LANRLKKEKKRKDKKPTPPDFSYPSAIWTGRYWGDNLAPAGWYFSSRKVTLKINSKNNKTNLTHKPTLFWLVLAVLVWCGENQPAPTY